MFSSKSLRPGRGWDAPAFNGVDDLLDDSRSRLERLSARAAYQETLFGRATLVDIRPQQQRQREGEVHPDLAPVVIERNVLEWRLDPRHPASLPMADLARAFSSRSSVTLISVVRKEARGVRSRDRWVGSPDLL